MTLRWAGNGPDARRSGEATLTKRVGEPRQRRRWAISGPPLRGDALFGRPRRRSSSTTIRSWSPRRRSLMPAENCVVAGSLGCFRSSKSPRIYPWPSVLSGVKIEFEFLGVCLGVLGDSAVAFLSVAAGRDGCLRGSIFWRIGAPLAKLERCSPPP